MKSYYLKLAGTSGNSGYMTHYLVNTGLYCWRLFDSLQDLDDFQMRGGKTTDILKLKLSYDYYFPGTRQNWEAWMVDAICEALTERGIMERANLYGDQVYKLKNQN